MNAAGQINPGNEPSTVPSKDRDSDQQYTHDECGSSQEEALIGTTPIGPNTGAGSQDPTARSFS